MARKLPHNTLVVVVCIVKNLTPICIQFSKRSNKKISKINAEMTNSNIVLGYGLWGIAA